MTFLIAVPTGVWRGQLTFEPLMLFTIASSWCS
jgi:hypothetical protein